MDITSCSTANTTAGSLHGYNLRKRSISNYYLPLAKRTKMTRTSATTTAVLQATSSSVTARPTAAKSRKERKKKDGNNNLKAKKWENFPNMVKEEPFEFDNYIRRSKLHGPSIPKSDVHVDQIPVCVMSIILKYLEPLERVKVERVCRRWHFIARNFAWNSTRKLIPDHVSTDEANYLPTDGGWQRYRRRVNNRINAVVNRAGKYLEMVNLCGLTFLDYKTCNILRFTPRVIHLDLSAILLTNSSLLTIGSNLPNLKLAVFRRCFNKTQVERGMSRFLQACRQLETLDVSDNEHFHARDCFEYLPSTLQHLYMSHAQCIANTAIVGIQRNCPDLRSLVMDRVDLVSVSVLNDLFNNLPNLEILQYGECYSNAMNAELSSIGNLTNLKQLIMYDNTHVTEPLLKVIGTNCRQLTKLDLSTTSRRISDQALFQLTTLSNLSIVNFSGMRLLSDRTLRELASHGRLTEVLLHRCHKITDNSVIFMLKRCKNVRILDVSYCELVTDATVKQIIENLNNLHGKMMPSANTNDSKKFCFWGKRSGITSPMPRNLTHPWMKLMNEIDYDYMLGNLIHWSNFGHLHQFHHFHHFPWMFGI